jgi:hypothetical protein
MDKNSLSSSSYLPSPSPSSTLHLTVMSCNIHTRHRHYVETIFRSLDSFTIDTYTRTRCKISASWRKEGEGRHFITCHCNNKNKSLQPAHSRKQWISDLIFPNKPLQCNVSSFIPFLLTNTQESIPFSLQLQPFSKYGRSTK